MSLRTKLSTLVALPCLMAGLAATEEARAGDVPAYFFNQWTVSSNCTEPHAGLAARVPTGLKFSISTQSDGTYSLQALDAGQSHWAPNWNGLKLEYRAGKPMTSVPADFVCIPGEESSSPFLAMSGYVQSAEPYYEEEHWYGIVTLYGQLEHVLIFPRNATGADSVIIVLQSASPPTDIKTDDDGVIHGND